MVICAPAIHMTSRTVKSFTCSVCGEHKHYDQFRRLPSRVHYYQHYNSVRSGMAAYARMCMLCEAVEREGLKQNRDYAEVQKFWERRMPSVVSGAKQRGILVGVGAQDLVAQWYAQDAKCALTGLPLRVGGKAGGLPSVDRVDSSMNYTPDNVQIVIAAANIAKHTLTQNEFIWLCQKVAGRHPEPVVKEKPLDDAA